MEPPSQSNEVKSDGCFLHDCCTSFWMTYPLFSVAQEVRQLKPTSKGQVRFSDDKYIALVAGNNLQELAMLDIEMVRIFSAEVLVSRSTAILCSRSCLRDYVPLDLAHVESIAVAARNFVHYLFF